MALHKQDIYVYVYLDFLHYFIQIFFLKKKKKPEAEVTIRL